MQFIYNVDKYKWIVTSWPNIVDASLKRELLQNQFFELTG